MNDAAAVQGSDGKSADSAVASTGGTWGLLLCAVASEVCATFALRLALDAPTFYLIVVGGYVLSFYLLGQVLRRGMQLGVAYGLWAALGVVLTVGLSSVVLGEQVTPVMTAGLALIVVGVLMVELGSRHPDGNE